MGVLGAKSLELEVERAILVCIDALAVHADHRRRMNPLRRGTSSDQASRSMIDQPSGGGQLSANAALEILDA
jgi:hypothetical protein